MKEVGFFKSEAVLHWSLTPIQNWLHPDQGEAPVHSSETCFTVWFVPFCGEGLKLQQDSEPKHTSELSKNYLMARDNQ